MALSGVHLAAALGATLVSTGFPQPSATNISYAMFNKDWLVPGCSRTAISIESVLPHPALPCGVDEGSVRCQERSGT